MDKNMLENPCIPPLSIGIKQALRSRTDFEVCLFLIRSSDGTMEDTDST